MKKLMTILAAAALGVATVSLWAADAPPTTAPAPTVAHTKVRVDPACIITWAAPECTWAWG